MSANTSEKTRSGKAIFTREHQRVGKYQILAELGRGGAANVSLAVTRGKGGVRKLVVLKALLPELAEESGAVAAFLDEARLAAQLNHPNVVQTYEVGSESGRHVIVMEYLEGQSLSRIIRTSQNAGKPLPAKLHLRILIEVLEGLHYAHEHKAYDGHPLHLVHRDVSPQNVIVTYDGQVKILDFGIAKAASSSTHTAAGIMKGKIAYMAPEQMAGTLLDRRADIYSIGCLLWAAATGKKLWQDVPDVQVVRAVVAGRIPSPKSVNPGCPDELERIIMRALSPDPEKRYATALDLQGELEHHCEQLGRGVKARDIGRWVCDLFVDVRAAFNENVENELSALIAADGQDEVRDSQVSITEKDSLFLEGKPATPSQPTKVDGRKLPAPIRRRVLAAGILALGVLLVVAFAARGPAGSVDVSGSPSQAMSNGLPAPSAGSPANRLPTPMTATIGLLVSPSDALIHVDGQKLAPGTSQVLLPISDTEHRLTVESDGHLSETRTFVATGSTTIAVALASKAGAKGSKSAVRTRANHPVAAAAPAPSVAAPPKQTAKSCDNPFFVDTQGIKRVRPECMQ